MNKVTFIDCSGTTRVVEAEDGVSLMEAAVQNLVPGIDGDCGGVCACATCHLQVETEWLAHLPAMAELEDSMLELTAERNAHSRLGCQIKLGPALDGIVVRTPASQH